MRVKELFAFIKERHLIYQRRQGGFPKPWTLDPILQQYRFCNVYRELDTVTQWIATNWREPHALDPDLWFAMVVARMFNLPSTLAAIGYPVPFNPLQIRAAAKKAEVGGRNFFNAAYMVRCDIQQPGKTKVDYLIDKVFTPMWVKRNFVCLRGSALIDIHAKLMTFYGMGSFMSGQVIADIKYVPSMRKTVDWWTWACPGPGSKRGMLRVIGGSLRRVKSGSAANRISKLELEAGVTHQEYKLVADLSDSDWRIAFHQLYKEIGPLVVKAMMPRISAQDLQNCLCEFDKYERIRLGEGRPKQKYPGAA